MEVQHFSAFMTQMPSVHQRRECTRVHVECMGDTSEYDILWIKVLGCICVRSRFSLEVGKIYSTLTQLTSITVGNLMEVPGALPPRSKMTSVSCSLLLKIVQNRRLAPPPGGLAAPPMGNPGSAPELPNENTKNTCKLEKFGDCLHSMIAITANGLCRI